MTKPTRLLDYDAPAIGQLIDTRGWAALPTFDQIGAIYAFVRDEIGFGYNLRDDLPASRVLADGLGQCNTKSTLLMALLSAVGVDVRLHGFTIHKSLQRGIVPEWAYVLAGEEVLHTWVEVRHAGQWTPLEGVIMDAPLLNAVQSAFPERTSLCAYGVGTHCLPAPEVDWTGTATFVQKTGIIRDLGLFDTPDAFYAKHGQNRGWLREALFRHIVRHQMNARVRAMRQGDLPAIPGGPDPAPVSEVFNKEKPDAA